MSYLTDKEKRLLFSALTREKKVCEEVDKEYCTETYGIPLKRVVESLERKFYYDRFEKEIRNKAIDTFMAAIEMLVKLQGIVTLSEIQDVAEKIKKGEQISQAGLLGRKTKKDIPKIHPSQKPVAVLKKLIEIFTDEGDVVIDPCCGSGSTLRAAAELGRSAYGFEIDRNFYERAKNEMLAFEKEEQMSLSDFID